MTGQTCGFSRRGTACLASPGLGQTWADRQRIDDQIREHLRSLREDDVPPRNPALQGSLWDYAAGGFRLVAGLSPSLGALAARLRLDIERSWEDPLGEVDAAMFSIRKIHFALSHNDGHPRPDTKVWVSRDQADVGAALDVLLHALGIGREALTYYLDPETDVYVDLHPDAGA